MEPPLPTRYTINGRRQRGLNKPRVGRFRADGGLQDAAYAHEKAERNIVWKLEKLLRGKGAVLIVRAADESSTMPR